MKKKFSFLTPYYWLRSKYIDVRWKYWTFLWNNGLKKLPSYDDDEQLTK